MAHAISNQYVSEGTATASLEITLPWPSRLIEIINDSATADLEYKFNSGETYATLKPLEVNTIELHTKVVYLNGTGSYRLRAQG